MGKDPSAHKFKKRNQNPYKKKGKINIDHVPDKNKGGKFGDEFKGGEYVDYEELN